MSFIEDSISKCFFIPLLYFTFYLLDVRQKLEELTKLYKDIQERGRGRQRALEETLAVAEKFWDELHALNSSLKDLQEALSSVDQPALEPEAIREQQEELEVNSDTMLCLIIICFSRLFFLLRFILWLCHIPQIKLGFRQLLPKCHSSVLI